MRAVLTWELPEPPLPPQMTIDEIQDDAEVTTEPATDGSSPKTDVVDAPSAAAIKN